MRIICSIILAMFLFGCQKDYIDCGTLDYFDENSIDSKEYKCFQDNMNNCIPSTIILDRSYDNKRTQVEIKGVKSYICYWEETNLDNSLDKEFNCEGQDEHGNYTISVECP